MPKPLNFHTETDQFETMQCVEPGVVDREFFHALLDEWLDAYEKGQVFDKSHQLKLSACVLENHDHRPDFEVLRDPSINAAVICVPKGEGLPESHSLPEGTQTGSEIDAALLNYYDNHVNHDGEFVTVAYLNEQGAGPDAVPAYNKLRRWAEKTF